MENIEKKSKESIVIPNGLNIEDTYNEININNLNDDCLVYIFKFLPVPCKVKVEMVCKKWQMLNKAYWSNLKKLEVHDNIKLSSCDQLTTYSSCPSNNFNIKNFLTNILKRCGKYVIDVSIIRYTRCINFRKLFRVITLYCRNINKLNLEIGRISSDRYRTPLGVRQDDFSDDNIRPVLNVNKNIRSISLKYLHYITGNCLLSVQMANIEKLEIIHCSFDSIHLNSFLSNLKNLKIFHIGYDQYDNYIEKIANGLIESQCQIIDLIIDNTNLNKNNTYYSENESEDDLEHISEDDFDDFYDNLDDSEDNSDDLEDNSKEFSEDKFLKFLSNQKKLQIIQLNENFIVDMKFLDIVKGEDLEQIFDLVCHKDECSQLMQALTRFKKLRTLYCCIPKFTDACVRGITSCNNIKELGIEVKNYLLSPSGESYFKKLQNLQFFELQVNNVNIDNILIALTQCENITSIKLNNCLFTNIGLSIVGTLPKLDCLDFSCTCITNEQLTEVVMNALHLKKLVIQYCELVNNRFIERASQVKTDRADKFALNIFCYKSNINKNNIINLSHLILVNNDSTTN